MEKRHTVFHPSRQTKRPGMCHLSALVFAAVCAAGMAGAAHAQTAAPATQEMQFPSQPQRDGSLAPPSTLRMTVTPAPDAAPAPAPIRDTPESVAQYQRCREVSDRAAVSHAQMQAGVAQCLRELQARRQQ